MFPGLRRDLIIVLYTSSRGAVTLFTNDMPTIIWSAGIIIGNGNTQMTRPSTSETH
jgi:hypothetical protein